MNFDFPTILVVASFVTGMIWLIDALAFAPQRRREAEEEAASLAEAAGKSDSAGKNNVAEIKVAEPILVEYARSFFPVIFAVLILRSFIAEPFRIPSGSMMPTLLVGDFILVNKFAYGLRLPSVNTKILDLDEPVRGDVVVFRYPEQPTVDYIKRVVGLPGDKIEYRDKVLYVNGQVMQQVEIGRYVGVGTGMAQTGWTKSLETIDQVEHAILTNPLAPNLPAGCRVLRYGPVTVPDGHYFMMGDNRDNSNDSRCWGFVPEENLVGKAFAIWMNWDSGRDGMPIAWERIGNGID